MLLAAHFLFWPCVPNHPIWAAAALVMVTGPVSVAGVIMIGGWRHGVKNPSDIGIIWLCARRSRDKPNTRKDGEAR